MEEEVHKVCRAHESCRVAWLDPLELRAELSGLPILKTQSSQCLVWATDLISICWPSKSLWLEFCDHWTYFSNKVYTTLFHKPKIHYFWIIKTLRIVTSPSLFLLWKVENQLHRKEGIHVEPSFVDHALCDKQWSTFQVLSLLTLNPMCLLLGGKEKIILWKFSCG